MEMERICGIDHLKFIIRESWSQTWSRRIVEQAELEKHSNSRLRKVMSLSGESEYCGQLIMFIHMVQL